MAAWSRLVIPPLAKYERHRLLTHLTIEGFKSFGSPGTRVCLEPLSFVVGANASGKSNLLLALKFVRQCFLHGVEVAVNELDGCREVRNRILREVKQPKLCVFSLSAENLPVSYENGSVQRVSKARYELALDLRSDDDHAKIEREELNITMEGADGESRYRLVRSGLRVTIQDPLAKDVPTERSFELYPQDGAQLVAANGLHRRA